MQAEQEDGLAKNGKDCSLSYMYFGYIERMTVSWTRQLGH